MREEIIKDLKEIIFNVTGSSDIEVKEDSDLINDLGLSSLDLIAIIGEIEDHFNITIEDDDISSIRTAKDIADYVESKTKWG